MGKIRAFDLFCGGGGSSIGARQAGAAPMGGIDCWDVATSAFSANLPGSHALTCRLDEVDPREVLRLCGPTELLLASPECTHHSVAKGNKPRNEESKQLAFEVIRYARVMKPRWIVVENVIQMASWESFPEWLEEVQRLGYNTLVRKYDAQHFGVPQSRRRLFIICDREGEPAEPRMYRKKNATVAWVLKNAAAGEWSYAFTPLDNGRRAPKTIERAERAIQAIGDGQEFIMVYYGSDGAGGFQEVDRPLRTITTLDRFSLVRPNCKGYEMRMLQPPELALAMGFPRQYRWPEAASRRDCIRLMGNAVCPPVMRAIVRALIKS